MTTLYEELGLSPDATPEEIKAAHRQAVKRTHPDAGGDEAKFHRVQLAYNVLSNPGQRERYDQTGSEDPVDPEALLRAQALTTVTSKLATFVTEASVDPRYFDVVVGIRELLLADRRNIEAASKDCVGKQLRLRQFQRRLKCKEGEDRIGPTIEAQVAQLGEQTVHLETQLRIVAAALELAAEYVYETDAKPPMTMNQASMHPGTWNRMSPGFFGNID